MVDAQAPGRPNGSAPSPRSRIPAPGWDGRLLEEYALLRLLAVAYRRQGELPAPLRETVRSRIGFSRRQADVLAHGQPVRDHWLVLARRDLEQDRIRVRRTWLQGRKTGRPALVLGFAAAGQSLDDTLAVGTEADADLVFYPGAVPLRAVVAARHDVADGSPPPGDTIAGLLAGYAAALAEDPWLDSWPAVLDATPARCPVPAVSDAARARRAAAPGRGRLLAAVRDLRRTPGDGGRRVDPARPVAADRLGRRRDGRYRYEHMAGPGHREPYRHRTIRGSAGRCPRRAHPGGRSGWIRPRALLDRAALLTERPAGGRLAEQADPLPVAEPDPEPTVSPAAGLRLARMLSGEHPELLAEWLVGGRQPGPPVPA